MRAAELRYRTLVEQLPLVVYVDAIDAVSSNLYTSPQVEPLLGYSPEAWQKDPDLFVRLLHPEDRESVLAAHERAHDGNPLSIEYRLVARDGRVVWVHDKVRAIVGASGAPVALQGYLLDITAAKATEEQLRHQAFHDPLTGLPNRTLFKDRALAALAAEDGSAEAAMLLLDIDDFKAVNDRFGHVEADVLLHDIGTRLRDALPGSVVVARLGGDEFAALVDPADDPAGIAVRSAGALIDALRAPFLIAGVEVFVTTSVGIALGATSTSCSGMRTSRCTGRSRPGRPSTPSTRRGWTTSCSGGSSCSESCARRAPAKTFSSTTSRYSILRRSASSGSRLFSAGVTRRGACVSPRTSYPSRRRAA